MFSRGAPLRGFFSSSRTQEFTGHRAVCRYFQRNQACPYGDRCRFVHADEPTHNHRNYDSSRSYSEYPYSNRGREQRFPYPRRQRRAARLVRVWEKCMGVEDEANEVNTVRVMSYNILANGLAMDHKRELYRYVPYHWIEWSHRQRLLLNEIKELSPDVMCLQEVDEYDNLLSELRLLGYDGVFQQRHGENTDGCATFWKLARLQAVEHKVVEFQEHGLRNNVALISKLRDAGDAADSGPSLVGAMLVANTHILFNPKRGDIKLGQMRILLNEARALMADNTCPLVVCGDFNMTPNSALYKFMSKGGLDLTQVDRRNMSGQLEESRHGLSAQRAGSAQGTIGQAHGTHTYWTAESVLHTTVSQTSQDTPLEEVAVDTTISAEVVTVDVEDVEDDDADQDVGTSFEDSEQEVSGRVIQLDGWDRSELRAAVGSEDSSVVRHTFELQSAYAQCRGQNVAEPSVTTYHDKFQGTVDYIWHTPSIKPVRVLQPYPLHELHRLGGILSENMPSDHLALVCDFQVYRSGDPC
eukprot:jgi/Chlat1/9025/Chrsp94S08292